MRKHSFFFLVAFYVSLFVVSFFVFVGQGFAAPVLDQSCDISGLGLNSFFPWQQEVTVGVKGELVGISLYFYPNSTYPGETGGIFLDLYRGSGWHTGGSDYTTQIPPRTSLGWYYIDVSSSHLMFDIGDQFVIGTRWDNSQYIPLLGANNFNVYSGGQLYGDGVGWSTEDLAFKTYIEPVPIPGDFPPTDCDVDGSDLAVLIASIINNTPLIDLATFAENFGESDCP